jgi:GNAT superfamily N-acetyltransferase
VYVASDGGEPAGCLLITDHEDNSDVECVAVVPEARGRGISGYLLGHALADAAERGIRTSTLVSTALGYPVYERAGYRSFGQFQMWQRNRGA